MKKCCLLIFAYLCLFSSISAQRAISTISLVPDKSVAVLRVNWTQVRLDEKLKPIIGGDNFVQIGNQIGVSEAKISEWVIFSDINPTSSQGTGIIVAGNFTSQSVVQFAKSKDWKSEKIGLKTAFINPADNSYLMPIRNELLAAGTKTGVEQVQSVSTGKSKSLNGKEPFDSVWTQLNATRQPINFYAGIPQEYQKIADIGYKVAAKLMNLASFGILGTVMETIGLVRSVGFNVSYSNGVYPTRFFAMFDSETKAWLASGALNLLKEAPSATGMQARTEDDKKMLEALQSLSANYKGEILSVKFDMPESAMVQR